MLNLKVTIITNVDGENKIMPNEVEETLRVLNAQISYYEMKLKEAKKARKEIMDKYDIPYDKRGEE